MVSRLENFIPAYPNQDVETIQWDLSRLREFNILKSSYDEPIPQRGEYFKHQSAILRLLRAYDYVLLVHETGTGKTCTMVNVAEYFYKNTTQIRQVYVLERGDTTKKDFRNQILTRCTAPEVYANNKRSVNIKYKIMSYGDFVKKEIGNLSDEDIIEKYSGCMFFIDEAHNIRNFDKRVINSAVEGYETTYDDDNYNKIKRLLRLVKRSKIIVSTATPMINHPSEVGKLMDLLNDKDIPDDYNWESGDLKDLEPYFRGKVSFIRALDTGIDVDNIGDKERYCGENTESSMPVESLVNIMHLDMVPGGIQDSAHKEVMLDTSDVWRKPKITSSFVSPTINEISSTDTVIGPDNLVVKTATEVYKWNDDVYNDLFDPETQEDMNISKYLSDYNRLKNCSVKFAFLLQNELSYRAQNPGGIVNEKQIEKWHQQNVPLNKDVSDKGSAFAYIDLVDKSGAIYLGLTLGLYGFEKFKHRGDVIDRNGKLTIPKKLRYGLMIHKFTEETQALNKVFNHPDNANGEYVQLIIGSEIARDGINLFNVTRGYLFTPDWHIAGMYQAMSRFIRSTSHTVLVEQRSQEIADGQTDLDDRVRVNVYRLSAVNSRGYSTDDCTYARAESKDYLTRRVLRFLKQVSFDCMIHYNRNVRETDVDYSQQCDYDECRYRCLSPIPPAFELDARPGGLAQGQGPIPAEYDYRNYNLLYERERRNMIQQQLILMINSKGSVTFEEVIDSVMVGFTDIIESREIIERYLYDSVDTMIQEKVLFKGIFGDENFLQTDGVNIFSEKEYPTGYNNYQQTGYYSQIMVGSENSRLDDVIRDTFLVSEDIQEELENISIGENFIHNFIETVPDQKRRIELLEKAIIDDLEGNAKPYQKELINYYNLLIYELPEQTASIAAIQADINRGNKRGARPADLRNASIKESVYKWEKDINNPNKVICHIYKLDNSTTNDKGSTKYNLNIYFRASIILPRILELKVKPYVWRDVTDIEYHVYPKLIEKVFEERTAYERRLGYFGYIYDNRPGVIALANLEKTGDIRQQSRGGTCDSKTPDNVISYFNTLKGSEIMYDVKEKLPDIETMTEFIMSKSKKVTIPSNDKLWISKVYSIIKKKPHMKNIACEILYNSFVAADRVIKFPSM